LRKGEGIKESSKMGTRQAMEKKTGDIGVVQEGTKRHLEERHLRMIAIGGTIGTGLFIKSGSLIVNSGPLGGLVSYIIAGLSVFCVVMALGEMAALFPISGSFSSYSERFVDPALGFTAGWSYWLNWVMTLPVEVLVATDLLGFWFPQLKEDAAARAFTIGALLFVLLALNLISVKGFGETEYWLSMLKIVAIVAFICIGVVLVFTNELYTFENWKDPDMFNGNGGGSIFTSMISACFAFGGTELVGITAGEAANPRKSIPSAIKGTFWRIMIFYITSIVLIGLILSPSYLQSLTELDPLLQSPFVLVFQQANIPGADHIMNAVAFIAIFSAGNSSVYASSRTLMALTEGTFMAKTSKFGVPFAAVLFSTGFGSLVFATLAVPGQVLFELLTNTVGLFIIGTWIIVCLVHIRFRAAYAAQGYKIQDLPYVSFVGVAGDYVAIIVLSVVIILSGLPFNPFDPIAFAKNYAGVAIYPILYFGHKCWSGSWRFVPLDQIDLQTGHISELDSMYPQEEEIVPKTMGEKFKKVFNNVF
jgi:lysine-specific permease